MIAALLSVAALTVGAAEVQVAHADRPVGRGDTSVALLSIRVGVPDLRLSGAVLPASGKPGDPRALVLVTDTAEREPVATLALVPATTDQRAVYRYGGPTVGLRSDRLLLMAPADANWARLAGRRRLPEQLELTLLSGNGEPAKIRIRAHARPKRQPPKEMRALKPLRAGAGPGEWVLPNGTWRIEDDFAIPAGVTLTIEPGTTLLLDPARSLLSWGKLLALGTPDAPITFEAAGVAAFGVVALIGEGATGSRLTSCRFIRGSQAPELDGALSVLAAKVELENVAFEDSRGEDAIHVGRGEITLRRGRFRRASSDGIDLEGAQGTLEDLEFETLGDDALDIGEGSRATVTRVRITGAHGKGISVGQTSEIIARDVLVLESGRGVAAFEGSRASVSGCVIAYTNRGAIQAAARKGREPGRIQLARCALWRNFGANQGLRSPRVEATDVLEDLAVSRDGTWDTARFGGPAMPAPVTLRATSAGVAAVLVPAAGSVARGPALLPLLWRAAVAAAVFLAIVLGDRLWRFRR